MKGNDFFWLQKWYYCHRDEDGKCNKRITIFTVDNPGWRLTVNLEGTELKNKEFTEIHFQAAQEDDWTFCYIRNNKFEGACGPKNFSSVLGVFKQWASNIETKIDKSNINITQITQIYNENFNDDILWLQQWYYQHCDGDWEHCFGIDINTVADQGWSFSIAVDETELENKFFAGVSLKGNEESDKLECYLQQNKFKGVCGPTNLSQVLQIFREWAET